MLWNIFLPESQIVPESNRKVSAFKDKLIEISTFTTMILMELSPLSNSPVFHVEDWKGMSFRVREPLL